jgi:rhamnosyltransferase
MPNNTIGVLRVAVVIPVLNGGAVWRKAAAALCTQTPAPTAVHVIDSGSTDGSDRIAENAGFSVTRIDKRDFDHGGTREQAVEALGDVDVVIFLTQDAVLETPRTLASVVSVFEDSDVGVAYGRQLPRVDAGVLEAHARLFNYPPIAHTYVFADRHRLGIKAAFTSNSFAAYRRDALLQVGGFPNKLILSEDMVVAAKLLTTGWSVAYVAEARVLHSHGYTIVKEFQRYFDVGVFHSDQRWILEQFGRPEGEGLRFLCSEVRYALRRAPWLLPALLLRTVTKYAGYRLGLAHDLLSNKWRRRLSMNKGYWNGSRTLTDGPTAHST